MNTYIIFDGYQDQYMVMDGELPSDSYKIGTTFDEYLLGDTFVKLSEEQVRFHANNPSAGVRVLHRLLRHIKYQLLNLLLWQNQI